MGVGKSWVSVLPILITMLPGTAWSSGRAHRHDGFFLRMAPGLGSASSRLDDGTDDLRFSGAMGDIDLAIGGIVGKNLALHGTLWGWSIGDPDFELNNGSGVINGNLTMSAVGIGVTYYFMPVNLYLSGSLGIGELQLDIDRFGSGSTNAGLVFEATVGKEWWVGRNWALGVAGALGLHSIDDDTVRDNWNGGNFAVRFSATFN